jgi:hypothetical protein
VKRRLSYYLLAACSATLLAPITHTASEAGSGNGLPSAATVKSFAVANAALCTDNPVADCDNDSVPNAVELQEGLNPNVKDNDVFASTPLGRRLFVMQMYRSVLGREGEADGMRYWLGRLDSGLPDSLNRAQMVEIFLFSRESTGGRTLTPEEAVTKLYNVMLGRQPEPEGLAFWAADYRRTGSLQQLCGAFVGSEEYRNRFLPVIASISMQDHFDSWVATDALGRTLPTYAEVGPNRANKTVGVFYYLWNEGAPGSKVYDIAKIIKEPDEFKRQWGPRNSFHFWGEPEYGYYRSNDPWVLRRDLQMLSQAKVDFLYFDVTNAFIYLDTVKALCKVSMEMRAEGIQTPKITFTTNTKSGETMNKLYDEFYSQNECKDLWFSWDGKPVMLGDITDPVLRADVKAFFTIRRSWVGSTDITKMENHWPWLNWTPQTWGWSGSKDNKDQVAVAAAFHPENPRGQSFTTANGQPPVDSSYNTAFTGRGLHAQEQWDRALSVDPKIVMVTQWNEWLAQRFIWSKGDNKQYGGRPISNGYSHFVDVFSPEFNRDMAPMKGGHTDNMYYQLVSNIRRYKGMAAPQAYSGNKTISIDGNFSEWTDVSPVFKDPVGDVMHRNHPSYDPSVILTNTTGRNDIVESRVTSDANNIYFYVKTKDNITASTDPHWMMLLINTDRNKATGWEGYDYVINEAVMSASDTTVKKYQGTQWSSVGSAKYAVNKNQMEISVSRSALGLSPTANNFYFKWADNIQGFASVENLFLYGDVAPDRRYDFHFARP